MCTLCEHMLSLLLGRYLGVELLGYMVRFNFLRNCQNIFRCGSTIYISRNSSRELLHQFLKKHLFPHSTNTY